MSAGDLAIGAAGAAIALAALVDLFVTVFNYDGFSFLANRLHGLLWKTMRTLAHPLPSLLASITEKLEDYDQGLRRYPVVYYFHTRRLARSIPRVFANLGLLVALLRWGLPAHEPMSQDSLLMALIDEYGTTLERLQRSFVGPPDLQEPDPLGHDEFASRYAAGDRGPLDRDVEAFREFQERARSSAGIPSSDDVADEQTYRQYRQWLPFAHRNRVILGRVADALGYELS